MDRKRELPTGCLGLDASTDLVVAVTAGKMGKYELLQVQGFGGIQHLGQVRMAMLSCAGIQKSAFMEQDRDALPQRWVERGGITGESKNGGLDDLLNGVFAPLTSKGCDLWPWPAAKLRPERGAAVMHTKAKCFNGIFGGKDVL